jgi:hypothetical protein
MPVKRNRPEIVAVQLTAREKAELKQAADQASVPLSVFVRMTMLSLVRRRDAKAA